MYFVDNLRSSLSSASKAMGIFSAILPNVMLADFHVILFLHKAIKVSFINYR
jgi:hypothetical protein